MDFAQAKIHSLVVTASGTRSGGGGVAEAMTSEDMKFKEVEARFLQQFSMPRQEKLVNCTYSITLVFCDIPLVFVGIHKYLLVFTDYSCSFWKSSLPRQGWMYLSVNHLCFYSYFMGAETTIILRWTSISVSV